MGKGKKYLKRSSQKAEISAGMFLQIQTYILYHYYTNTNTDNNPLHINAKSNHSPSIIKQIPASISRRISNLSPAEYKHSTTGNVAL